MSAPESFRLDRLTFTYPAVREPALRDVSFTVAPGQFVTLCGPSGCGKTTLLRQLKTVLAPHGERTGTIFFEGTPLDELDGRTQSEKIGFVLQSPENQLVTDKVWHELAFGLEGLGYDTPTIRLRVAEMASFFGIQTWFYKDVNQLSGGQKQLLNLAAVMAMQPSVLILDEPTSQLDPIAAADFLATVGKINRELGVTVLLTEHRLEDVFPLTDRCIVMDGGRVIADGAPADVGERLRARGHSMFLAMPTPMRVWAGVETDSPCPVTVRDGRNWLTEQDQKCPLHTALPPVPQPPKGKPIIQLDEVWFRYEKDLPDVVKGLTLSISAGEFCAIVGGNGTGKTTTLSLISGINSPYRGTVKLDGRPLADIPDSEKFGGLLGVLPQNPQALFVKKTVELDLLEMLSHRKLSKEEQSARVAAVAELCDLTHLLPQHPYDLSGGEQQRAALAKVLLLEPRVLLLDEPTKGMDSFFKEKLAGILKRLQSQGTTILMVSHDIEFCARYANRCAMFFDGAVVTEGEPRSFFSGNSFYTTAANRMARHLCPDAVTAEDVIAACGGTVPAPERLDAPAPPPAKKAEEKATLVPPSTPKKSAAKWKKPVAVLLLLLAAVIALALIRGLPVTLGDLGGHLSAAAEGWSYAAAVLAMTLAAGGGLALFAKGKGERSPAQTLQMPPERRKLEKRTVVAAVMILLLIPLTIFVGFYYLDNRKYYFISLLIILETLVPFFMVFEKRKPQARELVVLAVLCAIGVAGRAAFFMLPQFKPVAALVIIAAVAFGGESGFVVGALTMLLSNLFYSQGPATPWQMFAMGIVGFLAGVLFKKGVLRRDRVALSVFGFLVTFLVYGVIMNTSLVFTYQEKPTLAMLGTYVLLGVPFDLIHAIATAFFLWVAGPAMLEKLDRIKLKYGLLGN
ncbi:MAG: ATP-binding cassette domain-containing protein [Oscillospiraceae bacterium]